MAQEKNPLLLYFNGLGSGKPRVREELVLRSARARGYRVEFRQTNWLTDRPFQEELANDIEFTRGLLGQTAKMVLVGSSAGVSRAINVFGGLAENDDLLGIVGLCGRTSVGSLRSRDWRTLDRATRLGHPGKEFPTFRDSVEHVSQTVSELPPERVRDIVLFHHYGDEVVPHKTQTIEGASNVQLWVPGHAMGILAAGVLLPGVIDRHFMQPPEGSEGISRLRVGM